MIIRALVIFLLMFVSACTTIYHNEVQDDPSWAPSYPAEENSRVDNSGSIYNRSEERRVGKEC